MQITEVMTNDVSSVNPKSSIKETAEIMHNLNVGAVPVCEGSKAIGIITDRDIAIRNTAKNGDVNTPVEEIMSDKLVYGTPEMNTQEAAQLMSENQIRRLPIIENDNLVGIVSLGDLAVQSKSDMEAGTALSSISTPSRPNK
jgi:CBS domain-containing protein